MVNANILMVANEKDPRLIDSLPVGDVDLVSAGEALERLERSSYRVAIVDAGAADDPAGLVELMHASQDGTRIIVVTTSPTWKRARQFYQAGASEYLSKILDLDRLRERVGQYLRGMMIFI
jgi:DNA-binding NtrC family response regulator